MPKKKNPIPSQDISKFFVKKPPDPSASAPPTASDNNSEVKAKLDNGKKFF